MSECKGLQHLLLDLVADEQVLCQTLQWIPHWLDKWNPAQRWMPPFVHPTSACGHQHHPQLLAAASQQQAEELLEGQALRAALERDWLEGCTPAYDACSAFSRAFKCKPDSKVAAR